MIGRQPRQVTEAEVATLGDLASLVMAELELRLAARTAIREHVERASDAIRILGENQARADELDRLQRTLLDNMADGVVMQGHDERIVACNPAARALLGLGEDPASWSTGAEWRSLFLGPDGSAWSAPDTPAMATLRTGTPSGARSSGSPRQAAIRGGCRSTP